MSDQQTIAELEKEFDYVWRMAKPYMQPYGTVTSTVGIPGCYFNDLWSLANRIQSLKAKHEQG